jgi:hypothetical protein
MKILLLLYVLMPGLMQITVPLEDASNHVGKIIKVNSPRYHTIDDGRKLTFILEPNRQAKSVTISLTGEARKNILTAICARRGLNRQVKSPLDTSLTVTGKIVSVKGQLVMVISHKADIYLGADLQLERP